MRGERAKQDVDNDEEPIAHPLESAVGNTFCSGFLRLLFLSFIFIKFILLSITCIHMYNVMQQKVSRKHAETLVLAKPETEP